MKTYDWTTPVSEVIEDMRRAQYEEVMRLWKKHEKRKLKQRYREN